MTPPGMSESDITKGSTPSPRSPLGALLDLFSSVTFGIVLLVLLFIYMTIGSAGILYPIHPNIFSTDAWVHAQMRQWRPFEMTEFEWFHWWPFDVMLFLLCLVMTITTIRKIPLKVVNLGVWMIHTGIIVLCLGSVIYFATKVEGDAPVVRRAVVAALVEKTADGEMAVIDDARFVAMPGNRSSLGMGESKYEFEITTIDPAWEMLSGDDEGDRAYSVNVLVNGPSGQFVRQLIAGRPDYTEDLIFTEDPQQPFKRSVKVNGEKLVDKDLVISLDFESARWMYLRNDLAKSWALYLRELGEEEWVERPIDGQFLYNDYIADRNWIWNPGSGDDQVPIDPIDVPIPAVSPDDPAPDLELRVAGYLRYAQVRSQAVSGGIGGTLNPAAWVEAALPGEGLQREYMMMAFDGQRSTADEGMLAFRWVSEESEFQELATPPSLILKVPELNVTITEKLDDATRARLGEDFVEIEGTAYGYRVVAIQNDLAIGERPVSVAIVELKTPTGLHRRWVFDEPSLTRDVVDGAPVADAGHTGMMVADDSILVTYTPGSGNALVTLVAGPAEDRLRMMMPGGDGARVVQDVTVGEPIPLAGGLNLTVAKYAPRAVVERKPMVVPKFQRSRDAKEFFSLLGIDSNSIAGGVQWLQFHMYPFESSEQVLRRHRYRPSVIALEDGRMIEMLFSRRRMPLPADIALEEFVLTTHLGGYTGESSTIRDYTSMLRFRDEPAEQWSEPVPVSMNKPVEHGGYWYFQAQWDPPEEARRQGERASAGLNYTVLGVGNRHGVYIQLLGCCIAVIGMIYAFYIKPVIKQRERKRIYESAGLTAVAKGGAS